MKLTTYAQNRHELNVLKDQGFSEVILGHRKFSRFGKLTTAEFEGVVTRAQELGLRVVFEWDILMTENLFQDLIKEIPPLLENVSALRVQDHGALEWAYENTTLPLQFIAENGNHNLLGLETWTHYTQGRMERIILSIELPKNTIEEYVSKLKVPCELLGFGRILLFYTPRSLLAPLLKEGVAYNQELSAVGASEESPHKGFPILENQHGTFMFHIKEFSLIEFAQELSQMGLSFMRIDGRWADFSFVSRTAALMRNFDTEAFEALKKDYPQDLMRGFYLVNKTDVLFPKLKNHRLQKREGDYLGEVLEAEKGSHLAILVKHPEGLKRSDHLKFIHPEGKVFEASIYSLRDGGLSETDKVSPHQIALIQFVGGVWPKSHVFLQPLKSLPNPKGHG